MNEDNDNLEVKRPRIIWSILLGVALFGAASAMFIPAFAGMRQNPMSGYSAMIWGSAFFYALWRYRLKTGWHGALIGVVVGILLFTLAAFVGGYVRASGGV